MRMSPKSCRPAEAEPLDLDENALWPGVAATEGFECVATKVQRDPRGSGRARAGANAHEPELTPIRKEGYRTLVKLHSGPGRHGHRGSGCVATKVQRDAWESGRARADASARGEPEVVPTLKRDLAGR
jgi:hypothetical protein